MNDSSRVKYQDVPHIIHQRYIIMISCFMNISFQERFDRNVPNFLWWSRLCVRKSETAKDMYLKISQNMWNKYQLEVTKYQDLTIPHNISSFLVSLLFKRYFKTNSKSHTKTPCKNQLGLYTFPEQSRNWKKWDMLFQFSVSGL